MSGTERIRGSEVREGQREVQEEEERQNKRLGGCSGPERRSDTGNTALDSTKVTMTTSEGGAGKDKASKKKG